MESEGTTGAKGTVIRGDDGTIYFLRDEVLEAAKVTEPEMASFCAALLDANSGKEGGAEDTDYAVASGASIQSLAFEGPFTANKAVIDASKRASSTVMCPGTMGLRDEFVVNPAFKVIK